MKKPILISLALSSLFSITFSQDNSTTSTPSKKLSFGFNMGVGVNQSLLAT